MRNFIKLCLCLWFVSGSLAQAGDDPELVLVDALRSRGEPVKMTTRIEVYEQGQLDSQSLMDVYVGSKRRTLVVYRNERNVGQKVLMLDDKFWLFLPDTKRAMRITAMQKLMGEASVGDVASVNWADDYNIDNREQEGELLKLSLIADRKGLSYSKVTLWLTENDFHPVHADFYLKSGKLAKQAVFELTAHDQRWQISSMALQDRVQKDQQTIIYYDQIEPMVMQDKWFTPQYLLRAAP